MSAAPAPLALSRDVFDNAFGYEKLLRLYAPRGVALGVAVPVLVTAVHTAVNAARGTIDWESALLSWSLVALLAPLMLACGSALRARRRRAFAVAWWAQSIVQFVWLQFLCWSAPPPFTAIGAAIFCVWAFNDAFVGYDSPMLKAQYLVAFPAFDVFLFALDASGGRWGLHAVTPERYTVEALLVAQAALLLVTQTILYYAGTEALAHDRRVVAMASLERDLAVMRAERTVLQRSSAYLLQGIAATRFCHDIRSPLQVVVGNVSLLRRRLAQPPHEDDDALLALSSLPDGPRGELLAAIDRWFREAGEASDDLARAAERLAEMSRAVAVSIRDPEAQRVVGVRELMAHAAQEMSATLAGRDAASVAPVLDLEDATVAITDGHAATLGNLLANSALQGPTDAAEVRGRSSGPWFYHVALRDHGVAAAKREEALTRIRRSLSLEVAGDRAEAVPAAERGYQGYGIALMIAKVFLARYGGAIAVAPPSSGDGVVFHVLLPKTPYDQIPASEAPEDVLARAMNGATA